MVYDYSTQLSVLTFTGHGYLTDTGIHFLYLWVSPSLELLTFPTYNKFAADNFEKSLGQNTRDG